MTKTKRTTKMGEPLLIYVAGPHRGRGGDKASVWERKKNIHAAEVLGEKVIQVGIDVGVNLYPIIPHSQPWYDMPEEWFIKGTKALMRTCDAVVVRWGWEGSEGTDGEIKEAKRLDMRVFFAPPDGYQFSSLHNFSRWVATQHDTIITERPDLSRDIEPPSPWTSTRGSLQVDYEPDPEVEGLLRSVSLREPME